MHDKYLRAVFIGLFSTSVVCQFLVHSAHAEAPTLYLRSEPISLEQQVTGIVPRELVRQAVLISAADLGWKTRDASLREKEPENAISCSLQLTRDNDIITAKLLEKGKVLWKLDFDSKGQRDFYQPLVQQLTKDIGESITSKLKERVPQDVDQNHPIPTAKASKDHAYSMHLIKQFMVARELHATVQTDSSSENLAALARAYAHLSLLTRHHWSASSGLFIARSLLYSERAVAVGGDGELAGWSRAYCNAICGRHADALAEADKLEGSESNPVWAKIIVPCSKFEHENLEKLGKEDSDIASLAALLHFESRRETDNELEIRKAVAEAASKAPYALNLYAESCIRERSFEMRRWASSESVNALNLSLRGAFKHAVGFPKETKAKLRSIKSDKETLFPRIGDVAQILYGSEDELEVADLSWEVLGRLIQEEVFVTSVGFIADARNAVKTDLSPYTDVMVPHLDGHPYQEYIRAWGFDVETEPEKFMASLNKVRFIDPRPHMTSQLRVLWSTPTDEYESIGQAGARMAYPDFTQHSLGDRCKTFWQIPQYATSYVELFTAVSPHSPKLLRAKIWANQEYTDEQFEAWEKQAVKDRDSAALNLLNERLRPGDNWLNANIRILEQLAKIEPQVIHARMLAQRYLMRGERDKWESTLTDYLEFDSESFESTNIAKDLAKQMMNEGRWKDAQPYAEMAGSTFSAWGLEILSRCLEGLGEYEKSEEVVRQLTLNYGGVSRQSWYLWCKRNDQGDLAEAKKMAEPYYERPRAALDYECKSIYHQLEGDAKAALQAMMKANADTPTYWNEMEIAMLAYDLKEEDIRKQALEDLRVRCKGRPTDLLLAELVELAKLDEEKQIVTKKIDEYLLPEKHDVKCDVAYFTGEWLLRLGKKERAIKYLKQARVSEVERLTPTAAAAKLRELDGK